MIKTKAGLDIDDDDNDNEDDNDDDNDYEDDNGGNNGEDDHKDDDEDDEDGDVDDDDDDDDDDNDDNNDDDPPGTDSLSGVDCRTAPDATEERYDDQECVFFLSCFFHPFLFCSIPFFSNLLFFSFFFVC